MNMRGYMKRFNLLITGTVFLLCLAGCTKEKEIKDFTGFPFNDLKEYYSDKEVETVLEFSYEYPEGIVITQEISENLVTATVSKGSDKVYINSLVGQNIADAESILTTLGMTVKVDEVYSHKIAKDIVLFQSDMNYKLKPGSEITLAVSKGKEMIVVLDVSGSSLEDAVETLGNLGFTVKYNEEYDSVIPKNKVISQDILNIEAEKGSTINLTVSLGKKPSVSPTNNSGNNKYLANPNQQEVIEITGGNGEWVPAASEEFEDDPPVIGVPIGPEPAYGTVSFENENIDSYWYWNHAKLTYTCTEDGWELEIRGTDAGNDEFVRYAIEAFPYPDYHGGVGETKSQTVWVFLGETQ